MTKPQKVLALILCVVMCLSMLPTWALAEAPAEASETDAALLSEEPMAEVMEEAIPEEETAGAPPEEAPENAPEEASLQEEVPEAEEQTVEEPVAEDETILEPDAVSEEGSGESGAAGNDASPAEDTSEIQPNAVANAEETGEAAAASIESPAEPETTEVPAAEAPEAAEAVTVIFRIAPENAEPVVYNKDNPENPEEKTEIEPEEDGSYLLLPGEYFYTLTAEGYLTVEEEPLLVVPSEEPVKVEAVMTPADEELTEEVTEEVMLQAEARPEETADLMENSGTCGDNLTWTLDEEGTLTISGTGPMTDYPSYNYPWDSSRPEIKEILITEGVTSIGDFAFCYCSNLMSVVIPEGVTEIGSAAFRECNKLKTVWLPASISKYHDLYSYGSDSIFYESSNIEDVYYNGDQDRKAHTFGADALSFATWHYTENEDGWRSCGDSLFWCYDSTMRTLHIKGEGPMWGGRDYVGEVYYQIPWIEEYSGKVVKLVIEEGATSIGDYAFSGMTKLSSVMIPDSLTEIGANAFSSCTAMKSVSLPDSIEEIGTGAFMDCTMLTDIKLPHNLTVIEGELFRNCSSLQSIELPEGLEGIGSSAFSGCGILREINIPKTVTEIGDYAFNSCYSLTEIDLPDGLTAISNGLFQGCNGLSTVVIPEGVTSIGDYAFAWSDGPKSITIPKNVRKIGTGAFYWCDNLSSVSFPSDPPDIAGNAFNGVTANAYYPADGNWWEEDRLNYGGALTWIAVSSSSVHYDLMGGKGNIPDQQKTYGVPLTLSLLIPTKENGTFLGWAETPNATKASYQPGDLFFGEGAVTLYAIWEQIIEINAENFPDANFRKFIADSFDPNRDGKLTKEEISRISSMNCASKAIKSLKGIEFFTNLRYLWCHDNELTALDVRYNTELITLNCGASTNDGTILGNKLTSLDISKNTKLQNLHCQHNQIRNLEVRNNPELVYINCANNQISSLDLSRNLNLQTLYCGYNFLTRLDVSNNTELRNLECYRNQLTNLELVRNTKLENLHCVSNKLTALNVTSNTALKTLRCSNNQLKSLDVSGCTELTGLNCIVNQLENLNLTHNTKLQWLGTYSNRLTTLDLRNCPQLTNIVRNSERKEYSNHTVVEYNLGGGGAFVNFDIGVTIQPTIFSDNGNPEAYYHDPIYWAVDHGITTGRTATTFDPYGECTRGHIVTFLWRAFGEQEPTVNNPFEDVHEGDSFYKAVLWAYENGITTGQTATTFGPWNFCTRGQIVTFLWRAMGQAEPGIGNPFTDVNPGDGFYRAVLWAVENGITTGRTPTTFDPWATCTRGQAVTFLYRAMHG